MEHETILKNCPSCRLEKPSEAFGKDSRTSTGLRSYCKKCSSKNGKKNRERNAARETVYTPDFKYCPGCKIDKYKSEFNRSKSGATGLTSYCKKCNTLHHREFRYGVSKDWIENTLILQEGKCAICGFRPAPNDKDLCIDHNHKTNKVRGMLCCSCNKGIGSLKESNEILQNAIAYLNKHKEQ